MHLDVLSTVVFRRWKRYSSSVCLAVVHALVFSSVYFFNRFAVHLFKCQLKLV